MSVGAESGRAQRDRRGPGHQTRAALLRLLEPVVAEAGFDLEDVLVTPAGKRRQVRVIVDGDGGVSLDDVAVEDAMEGVIASVKRVSGVDFRVDIAPRRHGDPAALVANVDRIHAALDWQPRFQDLDTIVAHALNWERSLAGKREIAAA